MLPSGGIALVRMIWWYHLYVNMNIIYRRVCNNNNNGWAGDQNPPVFCTAALSCCAAVCAVCAAVLVCVYVPYVCARLSYPVYSWRQPTYTSPGMYLCLEQFSRATHYCSSQMLLYRLLLLLLLSLYVTFLAAWDNPLCLSSSELLLFTATCTTPPRTHPRFRLMMMVVLIFIVIILYDPPPIATHTAAALMIDWLIHPRRIMQRAQPTQQPTETFHWSASITSSLQQVRTSKRIAGFARWLVDWSILLSKMCTTANKTFHLHQ